MCLDATTATLNSASTAAENATAAASVQSAILSITDAITAATSQVDGIHIKRAADKKVSATADAVAGPLVNLLLDISGALDNAIATLGSGTSFKSIIKY